MEKEAIYCSLNPFQMEERKKVLQRFKTLVKGKTEIENGYTFEFDGNNENIDEVISIIKLERKCCSFLTFNLIIEQETRPIFLKINGPHGTKDFLLYELGL